MINNIRDMRKSQRFSQDEIAQRTGVTRQTINAIENNKYDPSLALAFELAYVLHTTVQDLFHYDKPIRLSEKEN